MLANAGADNGFATGDAIDFLDHLLRLDVLTIGLVTHGVTGLELAAVGLPFFKTVRQRIVAAIVEQRGQSRAQLAHMVPVGMFDLVNFRGVDIEVRDMTGIRCELVHLAGHPVIKARADGDQKIAIVHRIIGIGGAVHAEHVQA